jgi:hypothetical protein
MDANRIYYCYWAKQVRWSVREALNLLTRYFVSRCTGDDEELGFIKSKKRKQYWWLVSNSINVFAVDESKIEYQDIIDAGNDGWYLSDAGEVITRVDQDKTSVDAYQFIRWAFSEGIGLPYELICVIEDSSEEPGRKAEETRENAETKDVVADQAPTAEMPCKETECRFQKTDKGWTLQYEGAKLPGVKDWLGLSYIKVLLSTPGVPINVFELQRMAGDSGDLQDLSRLEDWDRHKDDNYTCGVDETWASLDPTAKTSYLDRLKVINIEMTDARKRQDQAKIDTLKKEAEFIQKALQEGASKSKDPEVELNRKRVLKAITDAIKNIGKLEEAFNYHDKPISRHLRRYIRTGAYCSYVPNADEPCEWVF